MLTRRTEATRASTPDDMLKTLEERLGRLHAKQRLGIEQDHEAQIFGQGLNFFHIENLPLSHALIGGVLKLTGLYWRGAKNAAKVELRHHHVVSPSLPQSFDGFTILQLSDLHADMSEPAMARVSELIADLDYDLCVLTGDFRGPTCGPYEAALAGTARVREGIKGPVYGVLGNHDTICMVPGLEDMGIRMLLNESETIGRGGSQIHVAGIDDAHFYRVDNIEKAAQGFPHEEFSILISHTPEIYMQAAHADFNLLLSRSYAWRPDLPARPRAGHARFGLAALDGRRALAVSRHDRLHIGRRRLFDRAGALQLPAGNHPAPLAPRLMAQYGRSRRCSLNRMRDRTSSPAKNTATTMAMSSAESGSNSRAASSGNRDSGIWSSPRAMLLG